MRVKRLWIAGAGIGLALAVGGGGAALAATGGSTPAAVKPATAPVARSAYSCEPPGHAAFTPLTSPSARCPSGTTSAVFGAQGPAGPKGATGPAGPQGPSGVVSAGTTDLGGVASVATGGGFVANATAVGAVDLKAGTYLVSLSAKATPLMTSDVQVFPQFFVYDQAANASFTGDLFNVGAGALESGGHTTIDSYYSGSSVITLTEDTTLHVYAFGYDSDTGAGTYQLDDLTVTAV